MAKLNTSQFCGLSTTAAWHSWLYNHDRNIYDKFIAAFRQSTGCKYNSELMLTTLDDIQQSGKIADLYDWLQLNYPYMIIGTRAFKNNIFPEYNPSILTYPRRIIFNTDAAQSIKQFVLDKIKYDYIIVENVGYVEYLNKQDEPIANMIPASNWLISNYRKNKL
jgi:hypothetical protein